MIHTLRDIQDQLQKEGLLISFSGRFSQGIIEELGEAVKKYLESEKRPKNDIYNIFSIFIEQTQNIKKYCTLKEKKDLFFRISNSCIVTIGKTEEGNYICSGNLVEKEDLEHLTAHIDHLISLDKSELKKLYKQKMREEILPDQLSAGIGLIDMARKAVKPLQYTVVPIDDEVSFFTLQAEI